MTAPTSKTQQPLVLGSSSAYRRALLERLQLAFECCSPDIDESPQSGETAAALVQRLARAKADKVAEQFPAAVVIASDQVCVNQGQILGKPHTPENAFSQLQNAAGRRIQFLTSLCVLDPQGQTQECISEVTVQFRQLSDDEIWRYIKAESPLDCAGSFKSEGLGVTLFESVCCEDLTALEGLPLIKTAAFLRCCGFLLP